MSGVQCVQDFVTAPPARQYRLSISPADSQDLVIGEDLSPFTALLTADGRPVSLRLSLEVLEGAGVVTVDSAGRLRAHGRGVARLRARAVGPQLAQPALETTLTVRGVVPRLGLATARTEDTLTSLGQELVLSVAALTNAGDTIPGVPIAWRLASGGGASLVDAATGRVRADANGLAQFEAAVDNAVAVRPVRVRQRAASIVATPDTVRLRATGRTGTLGAMVRDARNNVVAGATTSWRSLLPSVATVSGLGVVTAVGDGVAPVVALSSAGGSDTLADTTMILVQRARLTAVAGSDGQSGTVGAALSQALAVQLVDSAGAAVGEAGIGVWFVSGTPGAAFGGADSVLSSTDSAGVARATLTLSVAAGANAAVARGVGLAGTAVQFGATGVPATAQSLVRISGSGQTGTVGTMLAAPLVAAVRDGFGNGVPGQPVVFRVAGGGGTFGGADSVIATTDAAGLVSVTPTLGTTAGANTLEARGPAGVPVTFTATGTPAAASAVRFAVQPTATTSGSALAPAPQVVVQDVHGNRVTTAATAIQLAVAPGTGVTGAVLTGGSTSAQGGLATFANVSIDRAGTGYRLIAIAAGLTADTSASFSVAAGSADRLAFSVEPVRTAAGVAVSPPIRVTIADALGNVATGATNLVTLELGTTPFGGGGLFGTLQVPAVNGIATFGDVRMAKAAAGYRLVARSGSLVAATSALFDVTPGPPAQIGLISGDNQNDVPGATLGAPFVVAVKDAFDNLMAGDTLVFRVTAGGGGFAGSDSAVVVSGAQGRASATLTLGPGSGTNLVDVRSRRLPDSVVTFRASATPAGLRLAFVAQPSNAAGGTVIAPAVQVAVQDGGGTTQTGASTIVTLAISGGTGAAGAMLGGTVSAGAVNGIATFGNLTVDKAGTGYTLSATASGVTPATSAAFDVTVGAAARLVFVQSPASATAGASLGTVEVRVQDAGGNTVTSGAPSVGVAIAAGSGPAGASLRGTASAPASGGTAVFGGLSIDSAGGGYALRATATGLTPATSPAFTVSPAPASRLAFTVQPSDVSAGVALSPAMQVAVRDSLGNAVAGATPTVMLAITAGTGSAGATLNGGTATAQAGVATFAAASITKAGTGYALTASAAGLSAAVSAPFTVTAGSASRLGFVTEPGASVAGDALTPAVQVAVQDAFGNLVAGAGASVTIEIVSGTGTTGAVLGGTRTVSTTGGVAAFSTLTIDRAGTSYTLRANATGLAVATSAAFDVTAAPAESLVVISGDNQNGPAGMALGQPFVVAVRDRFGNPIAGHPVSFRVSSGNGTFGGADSIALTTTGAGQAVATLTLGPLDVVNTAQALAPGLTGTPRTFTATPVPTGAKLAFVTQPATVTAGRAFTTPVQVAVQSASGTTITSATSLVTLAITGGTGTAGAHLRGTVAVNAVNGVATFDVSLDSAGTGYTLSATAGGLTGATSATFAVTTAPPVRLGFTVMPTNTAFNQPITPSVGVAVQDSLGNTVTGSTATITVGITPGTGTAGAILGGTASRTASAGIATFAGLSIDRDGSGYSLTAGASGLGAVTSAPFNVFGGPARLAFSVEPSSVVAGAPMTPAVTVTVLDALGNAVGTATTSVTLAIRAGSGTSGAALSGALTVAASGGVATFTGLSLDSAGTGYRLTATAAGLTPDTSGSFDVSAGAAARLAIVTQPTSRTAGNPIAPAVQVAVRDAVGNLVTGTATSVTMALVPGSGAPGAALSGTVTTASVGGVATFPDLRIDRAATGYRLTATASGPAPDTSIGFSITVGPLAGVVITQGATGFASLGAASQFAAEGRDASGNVIGGLTVVWSTSDASVATVSTGGLVTAAGNGSATITATIDGQTAQLGVTVAQVVAAVVVTPAPVTFTALGQTQQFAAQARDANGNAIAGKVFAWSSTNAPVAGVDASTGLATAVANGSASIRATTDGVTGAAAVTVAQVVATVSVDQGPVTLTAFGQTQQYTAVARDANGNVVAGASFAWASDNTPVATVDAASGLATAAGNGSATITATSGGQQGSVVLTVAQVVASVTVTPGSPTLTALGATVALTAVARDANGFTVAGKTFGWTSDNTPVATVDAASGVATAVTNGSATITATTTGGSGGATVSGTAALTVAQATATVVVTPGTASIGAFGSSRQFSAQALDANANAIVGKTFAWSSSAPAIATVGAGSGLATAQGNGTANIIATVDGIQGSAALTVAQVTAAVVLTPASPASLAAFNATEQFTAVARDSNAFAIAGKSFTWFSTAPGVATVSATGLATAVGNGATSIIAAVDGRADTSSLAVQQIVTSVSVTPNPVTIPILSSRTMTAAALDANGFEVAGIGFTWATSNTLVVTVTANNPSRTASATRTLLGGAVTLTATTVGGGAGGANVAGTATAN